MKGIYKYPSLLLEAMFGVQRIWTTDIRFQSWEPEGKRQLNNVPSPIPAPSPKTLYNLTTSLQLVVWHLLPIVMAYSKCSLTNTSTRVKSTWLDKTVTGRLNLQGEKYGPGRHLCRTRWIARRKIESDNPQPNNWAPSRTPAPFSPPAHLGSLDSGASCARSGRPHPRSRGG
jgi:hypothetical protein